MNKLLCKKTAIIAVSSMVVIWTILVIVSNVLDGAIRYPAPKEFLDIGFNPEKSLKYGVISVNGKRVLTAVIIKDGEEHLLPLQESHYRKYGVNNPLFDNTMNLISNMELSKDITWKLLKSEALNNYPTELKKEKDIKLLPFLETPTKMLHGTNSRKHYRNIKRAAVGRMLPIVSKLILNPYNMLTNDSFYLKPMEEMKFGYFHGNNIGIYTNNEDITMPDGVTRFDIEAELAVVIGKAGKNIDINDAKDYIAGYLIFNDITDRDIQDIERLETYTGYQKSKYISVLSSYMLTDIDPDKYTVTAKVNGKEVFTACQDEISEFLSLEEQITLYSKYGFAPGQVIATGTMAGASLIELDLPLLVPGDEVEFIANQGFGSLKNRIIR